MRREDHDLKNRKFELSERLALPPKMILPYSYGLVHKRMSHVVLAEHFASISRIREMVLSRQIPHDLETVIRDLTRVALKFDVIQSANRDCWFTDTLLLGYPSQVLAKFVTQQLASAQNALSNGDMSTFLDALDTLQDEAFVEMLDTYIAFARQERQPRQGGFVIVASAGVKSPDLFITTPEHLVTDYMANLNGRKIHKEGGAWGITGAWLVHDVQEARQTLRGMFGRCPLRISGKRSVIAQKAGEAITAIEASLIATNSLKLSPWHADDDRAYERLGVKESAPTAQAQPLMRPAA